MQSDVLRTGAHRTMASALFADGDRREAARYASQGMTLGDASGAAGEATMCRILLGRIAMAEGRHGDAAEILTAALVAMEDREARLRTDVLGVLAEAHREQGNHREAAEALDARRDIEQAILQAERDLRLADLDFMRPERNPLDLTPRQREVLELLAQGKTLHDAGEALGISARTVKFHKQRIMERCDLHSDAELVLLAVRLGLTSEKGPRA